MAEGKEREGPEQQRHRQRPVEFRGLCTHYVEGEDIRVYFRYPLSSFQPHTDDKIKLYARGARPGKSIASARVGDSSKHRLCDGGLYKTGSVTIPTDTVRELATSQRSYVLFYGSGRLRQVVGKSEPFIICPQDEFPSIQIRSVEDSVYIEKLRAHSPIDNQPAFPKGVGLANGEKEMSFVMVSDCNNPLADWESLDEEGSLSGSESWSELGENLKPVSLSSSSHSLTSSDSESSGESDNEPSASQCYNTAPHAQHQDSSPNRYRSGTCNEITAACQMPCNTLNGSCSQHATSTPPPIPKPRNRASKKTQPPIRSEECCHTVNEAKEIPSDHHFQNSCCNLQSSLPKSSALEFSVSNEPIPKVAELTDSLVIIDEITPEKVTMLKNSNKELRMKVRVLHDKLHSVAEERDSQLAISEELQGQVSTLKQDKTELKKKNKKLSDEKTMLKAKCKRLENENAMLTQHCEKQVVQISQYEAQLTTVSAAKEGLRKQLHRATKKSKRYQESSEAHHKRQRNDHQKTKAAQVVPTAGGRSQPTKSNKTAAASQCAVRLQRPVIDVYVRDPPNKREMERGIVINHGDKEAKLHQKEETSTKHIQRSTGDAKVQHADRHNHRSNETGMHIFMSEWTIYI